MPGRQAHWILVVTFQLSGPVLVIPVNIAFLPQQLLLAPHYTRVPSSVPRGVASLLSQGCQPSKEETPHRKNTLNTARTRRTTRKLGVNIWAEGRAAPWNRSADLSRQEKKGHG